MTSAAALGVDGYAAPLLRMHHHRLGLIAALLPLWACSEQRQEAAGAQEPPCRAVRSTLDVGFSGGFEFFRISGSVAGVDGAVYVLDSGRSQIVALDGHGSIQWTAGGEGAGPEEMDSPSHLSRFADTLAVWDYSNYRLSLWSSAGQHLGIINLGAIPFPAQPVRAVPVSSRRILATVLPGFDPANPPDRIPGAVVLLGTGTLPADTLAQFWAAGPLLLRSGQRRLIVPKPFAAFPSMAVSPHGVFAIAVGERYTVRLFDSTGTEISTISGPMQRAPVTPADRLEYAEAIADRSVVDQIDFPSAMPAITNLVWAHDGSLLVKTGWSRAGSAQWDRWSLSGELLYSIILPDDIDDVTASGPMIYARIEDPSGRHGFAYFQISGDTACIRPEGR